MGLTYILNPSLGWRVPVSRFMKNEILAVRPEAKDSFGVTIIAVEVALASSAFNELPSHAFELDVFTDHLVAVLPVAYPDFRVQPLNPKFSSEEEISLKSSKNGALSVISIAWA